MNRIIDTANKPAARCVLIRHIQCCGNGNELATGRASGKHSLYCAYALASAKNISPQRHQSFSLFLTRGSVILGAPLPLNRGNLAALLVNKATALGTEERLRSIP